MADPIPVSASPVSLGLIVSILSSAALVAPSLAAKIGLTSPDAINTTAASLYTLITAGIAMASGIFALIKRVKSSLQPVTLTQAGADAMKTTSTGNSSK